MGAAAQTPFYAGLLILGDTGVPILEGARFVCPKNYIVPTIISNFWPISYAEGVRQPYMELPLILRDKIDEGLSAEFFGYFLARTSGVEHDTSPVAGDIVFWNGRTGIKMLGAKADSFVLSGVKSNQPLVMRARFMGTKFEPVTVKPAYTAHDNTPPLTFASIAFLGELAKAVWQFNLSYSNNHTPDNCLNGTPFPEAVNAGMPSATLSLTMQAASAVPVDNTPIEFTIGGSGGLTGAGTATFKLNNPVVQNPDDLGLQQGRVMREYEILCLGADAQTNGPLAVSFI